MFLRIAQSHKQIRSEWS